MNIRKNLPFLIIIFSILFIFVQFFQKNLYLFPGDYLISWYEPWKTDNFVNGIITLAHKPIADDTFRLIYPFKVLSVINLQQFQFPLWNPYNSSGTPLLAAINVGVLDPLNIFFFFFSPYFAGTFIIILQTLFVGLATYLFAKSIRLSTFSSIFTSFTYVFAGAVISKMPLIVYLTGAAILPLTLFILESYKTKKYKKKFLFLLAPFTAFLILSAHPQYVLYIFIFIFFYWFLRNKDDIKKKQITKTFLFPALFIFLGIGLASFQLIPSVELFRFSNLNAESSSFIFNGFLLPIYHYISALIPNFFGNPSTYNYWGYSDYVETAASVGLIPFFFAIFVLKAITDNNLKFHIIFNWAVVILVFLLTYNSFLANFIYGLHLPLLSLGVPSRLFLISSFSLSILAGMGFDYWFNKSASKKYSFLTLTFFWILLLILLFLIFKFLNFNDLCRIHSTQNCDITSLRNSLLEISCFLVASFCFIFYLLDFKAKKVGFFFPILIISIVYILGIYNIDKFLPFSPKTTFFPKNELISEIQQNTLDARIFGIGSINIATDFATYLQFFDPQYFHPFFIKRYAELIDFANTGKLSKSLPRSDINIIKDSQISTEKEFRRNRLLDLLSIKYLIYKKSEVPISKKDRVFWENNDFYIKINPDSLPRAYLVNSVKIIDNKETALSTLFSKDFNPFTTAIVENRVNSESNNFLKGTVKIENYQNNFLQIRVNAKKENFLVVTDNYFIGWKAYVDGKETRIYRTNYTLRGILIPEGNHHVRLAYEPFSFKLGIAVSFVCLLLLLIIFLI